MSQAPNQPPSSAATPADPDGCSAKGSLARILGLLFIVFVIGAECDRCLCSTPYESCIDDCNDGKGLDFWVGSPLGDCYSRCRGATSSSGCGGRSGVSCPEAQGADFWDTTRLCKCIESKVEWDGMDRDEAATFCIEGLRHRYGS